MSEIDPKAIRKLDYSDPELLLRMNFRAARLVRAFSPRYRDWVIKRTGTGEGPLPSRRTVASHKQSAGDE